MTDAYRFALDEIERSSPRAFTFLTQALAAPPRHGDITLRFQDGKLLQVDKRETLR